MVGAARDRRRVFRRPAKQGVVYLPR